MPTNRQVRLAQRPTGPVTPDCYELAEGEVPDIGDGEALVRVDYLSIDPTIRGWMERDTYLPAIAVGDPIRSAAVGEVVESRHDGFPVGTTAFGLLGWQDYAVVGPGSDAQALPGDLDPLDVLGVYGVNGVTAYFGLFDVGGLEDGETVLVSGAAGATGSLAGQIAKIKGCRVVGIAGTDEKCAWVTDDLGFDAAINYRTEDVGVRIGETCPGGVDLYFDNVGGPILESALEHLALRGRIVLCGSIAGYDQAEPLPGPRNLFELTVRRGRMEGFIVLDYVDRFAEAVLTLAGWVAEGRLKHRIDLVEGLEHAPDALGRLFSGANIGKVVVAVR